MSQYLIINRLRVQNANCVAGFTWGFPAITHFLGFTHYLERETNADFGISVKGCAVICHDTLVHCYQSKSGRDFEFIQSKNPPYLPEHNKAENAPIVEEGRMNMTVSLIIKLDREFSGDSESKSKFEQQVADLCKFGRLAGGTMLGFESLELKTLRNQEETATFLRAAKRKLMPGFVLRDRSLLLEQHLKETDPEAELLDAWLDFSSLKYKAIPQLEDEHDVPNENTKAEWQRCEKPFDKDWLVPLMVGYKAISPVYKPGEVANVRDESVPACFVEAVHSIGEWQSFHRVANIDDVIWQYSTNEEWYLCRQDQETSSTPHQLSNPPEKISFEEILATI